MAEELTGFEPAFSSDFLELSTGFEPRLGGDKVEKLLRDTLLGKLTDRRTTHLRRLAISVWLAESGDTREGVGLREDGLPDFRWHVVNKGNVLVGDYPEPFPVRKFYIARYPVTWAQYSIFLHAPDGHLDPTWWEGLRHRADYVRTSLPIDNNPAQEVSWYDAVAYTRWLNSRLEYEVRLPTEWEWQQAASGGDPQNYVFPWGAEWNTKHANTREARLRQAIAVGMYPEGASPVGALDMSGTVLEWCLNEYADPSRTDIEGDASRALRGGSWFLTPGFARTTSRTGDNPYYRFNSVGFRLAADNPLLSQ